MSIDILSWNCRGICNDTTTRALKDLIAQNRPQIVFICETKISQIRDFNNLHRELGFAHYKEVLSDGQSGGLGLFWTEDVNLEVKTWSHHHIDMVIGTGPGQPRWRMTGFYGYARTSERDSSWQLLKDLCDLDSLPWLIIGDFNEILNSSEKLYGPIRPESQMRGFREVLDYGDLVDLGFQGSKATWWNSQTQLRLDRAVGTNSWSDIFGYARVRHLPPSDSDHIPILLQASSVPLPTRPKRHRFKFESFWLQHQECDPLVANNWHTEVHGAPMFCLTRKITKTRQALEKWQYETFRLRQQQMMQVRGQLESLMDVPMSEAIQVEKKSLMVNLQTLLSQEEAFWKQRAKVMWLQEGDRNSGFFHKKAANRKRKNNLVGLYDDSGRWHDDDDGMERVVSSYFAKMFTASPIDIEAVDITLAAIQPSVTDEMNMHLCAQYTADEVRCALFQMYPTKSPGPDGMPPLFFQHYWDTIGQDVTTAVQSFLHTGLLLKEINFTHICLIPKVQNPENMSDLRPIALCNVIYKLCSKVIANRLKTILPTIISPFQSAFVPGRLITDNILVANEVAHYVHNKREGLDGYMALKLDLSKAYDRMEWSFLKKVLVRFGFAQSWIEVVMQCVSSVRYSFLVRGKPRGVVVPSRGLRQGDPLSPYLFLLGAEGFSALLQQKQVMSLLPGIAICRNAPSVNHLLFADDSMLYAKANPEACFQIKNVIEVYGRASGQVVNFNKSSVVFSKNTSADEQLVVANILGVEIVESHDRYLGLPTYVGRKKTATFQYIKERLAEKLKSWQGKLLSGAGKDIMIRVVAQALPTYAMSVFQLTKSFCEDLEQMCARFWWGSTVDKRKIHWKSWDFLCHPKENGGLGFRSLSEFNLSMLAKQAWRVIENPSSLVAQLYKARYFPHGSFWTAEAHSSPSFSWRSIFATRELLKEGSRWQIGNGNKVFVWSDDWIPGSVQHRPQPIVSNPDSLVRVNELLVSPGQWDEHRVRNTFSPGDADAVLSIPLSVRNPEDRRVWHLEKKGMFTVKSAYRLAFSKVATTLPPSVDSNQRLWKKIWHANIPNTAKVTSWKICNNILPTLDRLASRHVFLDSQICALCNVEVESNLHLSRNCSFTREVLSTNLDLARICFNTDSDACDVIDWLSLCSEKLPKTSFGKLLFFVWGIWKERNDRVWDNKITSASDIALMASTRLSNFIFHNTKVQGFPRVGRAAKWKAPPPGWLKLNIDAAFVNHSKKGSLGCLLRDSAGSFLTAFARPLSHLLSAEHAELLACKAALEFIATNSLCPVIVETDCLLLQQQLIQSSLSNTSDLGRIYEDLKFELELFHQLRIVHVKREANKAAHAVASFAASNNQEFFWSSIPSFIQAVIASELCTS